MNELLDRAVWLASLDNASECLAVADAKYPGSPCGFRAVANMLPCIKNSYALLLGPEICLYNAQTVMSKNTLMEDALPDNFLLLTISSDDLVFGISQKLKAAVADICGRLHPEILFVVTTCLLEIIGEDFDTILSAQAKAAEIPIIGIHTENFTSESPETGLENMMTSLLEVMKPQPPLAGSVNVWGMQRNQLKNNEIMLWLKQQGITINAVFPGSCHLAELQKASAASLNLVMRPFALKLAQNMETAFGIPYFNCEITYTPEEIAKLYQTLGHLLKIENLDIVQEKQAKLEKRLKMLRNQVAQKSCVVNLSFGAQSSRVFNFIALLHRLELEVKALFINEIRPEDWADIQRLQKQGLQFPIFKADHVLQHEQILKEMKPDYYIGPGDKETMVRLGIELKNPIQAFRTNGFATMMKILKIIETTAPDLAVLEFKENYLKKWGETE